MKKLFLVATLVGLLLVACSPTFPTPAPSPTPTPFEYSLLLSPSAPTAKAFALYFGSDCLGDGQSGETHAGRGNSGGEYDYCFPEETPEPIVLERVERDIPPTLALPTVVGPTPTPATPAVTASPEVPTATPEPPVVACVGNPGNRSCNGNAGEDPNGKGTMPLDSSDGNGARGNSNRP